MGALTDQRKRSSAELRLPLSPLFSSPTKKPRLASPTSPPFAAVMQEPLPSKHHTNHISSFSRPIHGPQRIIKSFGLGSSPAQTRRPSRVGETPNFFSQHFRRKPDEGLDLHEYRRLVEEHAVSPDVEPVKVKSAWQDSFSPEFKEAELFHSSDVPSLRVEDEKNRALESEGAWPERILVKGEPFYKELHAKAKERDGKLNDLEFQVKFLQQKFIGLRKEAEVLQKREEKPNKDLEKLFGPLVAKEEEEISRAFSGRSNEVLVTHESSNIVITREVLQCLRPGAWLNDEVINLYLELLKEREKREPKKFLKCHFFNTFFYKRLISAKQGYDFKAVKRWTTQRKLGYSLIECDKIFVPIHKEIHWCLVVINIKDKSFQYLDSLGGVDKYVLKVLARYLMDESCDKSAKKIDTSSWKKESVDELPLQKNGWDCGMFMLKYADFYSRGLKLCFSQEHMSYFRDRTALEIIRLRAE